MCNLVRYAELDFCLARPEWTLLPGDGSVVQFLTLRGFQIYFRSLEASESFRTGLWPLPSWRPKSFERAVYSKQLRSRAFISETGHPSIQDKQTPDWLIDWSGSVLFSRTTSFSGQLQGCLSAFMLYKLLGEKIKATESIFPGAMEESPYSFFLPNPEAATKGENSTTSNVDPRVDSPLFKSCL